MKIDKRLLVALYDDPDIRSFFDSMTPEESRRVGAQIIKEQAERNGISEIAAMNTLAPIWIAIRRQALEVNPKLAEHLTNLIKMCD